MDRAALIEFLRRQPWAVEATVGDGGAPQAAVIGVAVTDQLELVFDTFDTSRKHANLRRDPRIAMVVGWDDAQTVQLDGVADQPTGDERARLVATYLARFPDGVERQAQPGCTYWRVRPRAIRYSDFRGAAPTVVELDVGA